jgi:ubiquinone/menaquinone biosynthesis C-methylase UbiE
LETRKFQIDEVARIFHVPPHMIGDLEHGTFSNIEHQAIEFVKYCLGPWLKAWESEIHRKLLAPTEKGRYFAEFLEDALLRGDTQARFQAYATGRQWGWYSANDVRELENMNPVKGGDEYMVPLNMMPASMQLEVPQEKALQLKAMSPQDWEDAYSEGVPHWASDMTPSKFAQEFLEEMRGRKIASVLEIGCGNGRDSILFARAGVTATAIDVTEGAIKLATENARDAEVDVTFLVANAEQLPFPDAEFGAIFSLSVLHASKLSLSIPEAWRVLKPTGIGFIYLYGDTQFADGHREEYTTVDAFTELLKATGFTLLDFYSEQEDEFDEYGEKHQLLVTLVQK